MKRRSLASCSTRRSLFALLGVVLSLPFVQGSRAQTTPQPVKSETAEHEVSSGKRSSGIKADLALRDAEQAAALNRVVVSTDIGGTDPDDFQSMVHLLLQADRLEIEGLISSPFGPGRKEHILQVIDVYERDYPNLVRASSKYPPAAAMRAIAKQGEVLEAPLAGFRQATEGSEWLIRCARRNDPRALHVLIWGGIEDLAQALHDAPDILPKLNVYFIGGPNKKWSPNAYHYIATHHPGLRMIEANSTYRGWFTGGNQSGEWGNRSFFETHIAGHGALGGFFATQLGGTIKMGDSPSVGWLIGGNPADPSVPGWGGRFVRAWKRPYARFERLTKAEDRVERFAIVEIAIPLEQGGSSPVEATMEIENQKLPGEVVDGSMVFRLSPKDLKEYRYTIHSKDPALEGSAGGFTAVVPPPEVTGAPDPEFPNWWTDDPAPEAAEGHEPGAKSVSRWREAFLGDFAARMDRCRTP